MKAVNQNKLNHPLAELAKHQKPLDGDISEWVDKHFYELI